VLVQSRSHLVDIVAELARQGIAFNATDIDPLGKRPAVLDLLALTRALAHLADRAAWLSVLRAPWCGLTLADLHVLVGDDRYVAVIERLREPARHTALSTQSRERLERTHAVLETAIAELRHFGLRDTVERAWHALGGPATLASLRELDEAAAYFDALDDVEADEPGVPVDLSRLSEGLRELYAPSPPHPDTRVDLLTIHKAKGLQFDTVVVPGLDRRGRGEDPRLLHWLKIPGKGGRNLVVAPLAEFGAERNPLYAWLERLEREKLQQERRRLLYVAATRAERALHLMGACVVDANAHGQPAIKTPNGAVALGLLWREPTVRNAFLERLAAAGAIEGEPPAAIVRDPLLRRLPVAWRAPEPPAVPAIFTATTAGAVTVTEVEFDWATETARHVGTVVHRELQRLARAGGALPAELHDVEALQARYLSELAELGVPLDRRPAAVLRVLEAVRRTLADERGRWVLGQGVQRDGQSELALTGAMGRDIVSVVIDRTFVDRDGVRWIVDYKTSTHEGAGLDAFLDSEQERYRPQLERYWQLVRRLGPEPVRLGLYFPLLSGWREWGP
jgi:ATP-dependent exoDNAse (exonuclease V) beta subunit